MSWRWILPLVAGIIAAVAVIDCRDRWGVWFTEGTTMFRDDLIQQSEP